MNILLADGLPALVESLRGMGHTVREIRPGGGVFHLSSLLEHLDFSPDLFIQQESLGLRNYFGGLEHLPFPTIFWAVDSHLNLFWHQWYGLLFDAVCTPHLSLFASLPAAARPRVLERMAWPGELRMWKPHAQRSHSLSFCGRLTPHRPVRNRLVELLLPKGLHHAEGLEQQAMMALYDDSRIVPNECIAGEVNFRLVEAASCGCLVLSPDVGEDQQALFEPGRELLVYHDGLELLDQLAWARMRPEKAEGMGKAAAKRIEAEHLPRHRAQAFVDIASSLSQHRLRGALAKQAFWLVLAKQIRAGALPLDVHEHIRQGLELLRPLPQNAAGHEVSQSLAAQVLAQCLYLHAEKGGSTFSMPHTPPLCFTGMTDAEVLSAYAGIDFSAAPDVAAACSALALAGERFSLAQSFWRRCSGPGAAVPEDAAGLCIAWADVLEPCGKPFQPGFPFQPEAGGLPESALEYLVYARYQEPQETLAVLTRMESLLAGVAAYGSVYQDVLAAHCGLEPGNWRLQLEYGRACLRGICVDEGIMAIDQAGRKAVRAGEAVLFEELRRGA